MMTILINIVAFIVAIGILVTFHEFGHYWTAKRLGVKVLRFSVGFGKPLWTWRDKHQTEFVIAAIPLGGYVKMLNEQEGPVSPEFREQAFNRQKLWKRFAIVAAGPIFNFIFAVLAYWAVFMIGIQSSVPIVGTVVPYSIAEQAGMQENEEIIRVNQIEVRTWHQIVKELMGHLGSDGSIELTTQLGDHEKQYNLNLSKWELKGDKPDFLGALGIEPYLGPIKPIVHEVMADSPAAKAGLKAKDIILSVGDQPITEWRDFSKIVARSPNKSLSLLIQRDQEQQTITIVPGVREGINAVTIGYVGIMVKGEKLPPQFIRTERFGPLMAFAKAVEKTGEYIHLTFTMLGKMLTGNIGLKSLSGPITIAQGAGATATIGIQYFLSYLALISVSLGVLNLLPIPILDGGHLFYFTLEAIFRRPISERVQFLGYRLGLFLLLFIMSIAFINDISRLM